MDTIGHHILSDHEMIIAHQVHNSVGKGDIEGEKNKLTMV
jgi:hypothetical protein